VALFTDPIPCSLYREACGFPKRKPAQKAFSQPKFPEADDPGDCAFAFVFVEENALPLSNADWFGQTTAAHAGPIDGRSLEEPKYSLGLISGGRAKRRNNAKNHPFL